MKKFLAILCAAVMVAGLATSAFAFEPEGNASIGNPFNALEDEGGADTGTGAGGTGTTGGGTVVPVTPTTPAADGTGSADPGTPAAGTPAATEAVVANIADYEEESLAKILVRMLNGTDVFTSAQVVEAMKIDGEDEKTVKGTAVDTKKLVVISKALDEKSTGVKYTKNEDDGPIAVKMNGNELTKGRTSEELVVIAAPKDPEEKKAYMADVELDTEANTLSFTIPMDAAICVTLIGK